MRIHAGPMLRRSAPEGVCVWLCSSVAGAVRVRILEAAPLLESPRREVVLGEGEWPALQVGKNLFVVVVEAKPFKGLFPVEKILAYDVEVQEPTKGYVWTRILPEILDITYPPFDLPTFVLRSAYPINVLHGSCRKVHGKGFDALPIVDDLLQTAVDREKAKARIKYDAERYACERPSALYLTGDQIYADDVPDELLDLVATSSIALMGDDERIAAYGGELELSKVQERDRLLPFLSSDEKKNHLVGFGEFASAYLYAFSPDFGKEHKGANNPKLLSQSNRAAVRRALANIPTYMICDDHEVSDDWNISKDWQRRVEEQPTGRRLLANALAAYWVFQHWGNVGKYATELNGLYSAIESNRRGDSRALTDLVAQIRFDYQSPGFPVVIVLDTRTRRVFEAAPSNAPARLMSPGQEQDLAKALTELPANQPAIVVSPTPVVMSSAIVEMGRSRADEKSEKDDFELWEANLSAVTQFKKVVSRALNGKRACVFFSGDVHFGSRYIEQFDMMGGGASGYFVQFTSSAVKNEPGAAAATALELLGKIEAERRVMLIFHGAQRVALDEALKNNAVSNALITKRMRKASAIRISAEQYDAARLDVDPDFVETMTLLGDVLVKSNVGQLMLNDPLFAWLTLHQRTGKLHSDHKPSTKMVSLRFEEPKWKQRTALQRDDDEPEDPMRSGIWLQDGLIMGRILFAGFDVNSTKLPVSFAAGLSVVAQMLKTAPGVGCTITGRASETGPEKNNQMLSERRADAIARSLKQASVPSGVIREVIGVGSKKPLQIAKPDEDKELGTNRSVMIRFAFPYSTPPRALRPPTTLSQDWSIHVVMGNELGQLAEGFKVLALMNEMPVAGHLARLTNHGVYPAESKWMILPAFGLSVGLGLEGPLAKQNAILAKLKLLPDIDLETPTFFKTREPCSFYDFHKTPFLLYGAGFKALIGRSDEWIKFLKIPTMSGDDIPIGGYQVGSVGLGGSVMMGVTTIPEIAIPGLVLPT